MRYLFLFLSGVSFQTAFAQYHTQAKNIVDSLTSQTYWGRGYTQDGLEKAAGFISRKFNEYGLTPMAQNTFFQEFSHPVNTFPGKMELEVNGKTLMPGIDFIVSPESRGIRHSGKFERLDSASYIDRKNRFILQISEKLTWSVATEVADYTAVNVKASALSEMPEKYKVKIDQSFVPQFAAKNVTGFVRGTLFPDSVILITAHYDHLGGMGADTYFPGANDNASGVALLLCLANYYAQHPAKFSIAFICFAGEEAGLLGSKYYTEHPIIPLKHIRFLWNTDLAGTGEEGITVVNATEFPMEFDMLKNMNQQHQYLKNIMPRGKAANSDHYFFTELGVPGFFFYTMGGSPAYHDVQDVANNISLLEIDDLIQLILRFNEKLMHP